MTDAPFTETHRETLKELAYRIALNPHFAEAIDAALAEIERLTRERDAARRQVLKAAIQVVRRQSLAKEDDNAFHDGYMFAVRRCLTALEALRDAR